MAGIMNEECFPYRPLLIEHLLLGTALPEDVARHLDTCPECGREVSETDDVVRTLRRAGPLAGWKEARPAEPDALPSGDLGDRIRRELADPRTPRPGYRRRIVLGVAAACAAAAAVVVPLSMNDEPAPVTPVTPVTPVAMVRQGKMVERPWGTEVPVALSGLKSGETYRMMTLNEDGTRIPGGSVRADSDEQVSTRMMTAMRRDTITTLIVEDENGRVVTRVPVHSSSSR